MAIATVTTPIFDPWAVLARIRSQAPPPPKVANSPNRQPLIAPAPARLGELGELGGGRPAILKTAIPLTAPLLPATPEGPRPEWRALPYGPERGEAMRIARCMPDACRCCAGLQWWWGEGEQAAPRCLACHPPPPGLVVTIGPLL